MLGRNLFLSFLLIVILLSAFARPAFAVTTPTFPVCANPQGEIKVTYTDGVHGVPGDTTTYSGQDTVYTLSDTTLTQCLCTVNGGGIQTNWWKVSSLTRSEKNILINQGWILIPDGSAWGLQAAPYLAQNTSFSCATSTSNSGNPGGPGDGLSDGRSDGRSDGLSSSPQAVLGVSTQAVLGLASTGNIAFILTVVILGIVLLSGGIISSFKKKQ
jgi:hypothetical protein